MKPPENESQPSLSRQAGEWVLVLKRTLNHPIEDVWAALTEAQQLPAWGPFASDRDLLSTGPVTLSHVNYEKEDAVRQGEVIAVEPPHLLLFQWGPDLLRWELSSTGNQTILVLQHRFRESGMSPSFAAGWTLCLKGLTGILEGKPMPSMAGSNAMLYGWKELHDEFKKRFEAIHDETLPTDKGETPNE
ncbi:SRPBCC family protein [Paenibacillus koleovorans]|uniref:SRPBCC family protein n=1 Tax=Paenibacillus koleovorans TaxID=121608 RepID=UPI000FD75D2C|nr:SRPBCC family protein [Paenibacillus koleovorans]